MVVCTVNMNLSEMMFFFILIGRRIYRPAAKALSPITAEDEIINGQ